MISASNEKPSSRLNQRTFGVTNRIWLIISLFLSLIALTRFILPSSPADNYYYRHHSHSYAAHLKPTNYLNISEEVGETPFEFCPTFGPGDELAAKHGALAVSKSWLHLGSGARVQKVIHKAMLGQPVTISIIGGSGQCLRSILSSVFWRRRAHGPFLVSISTSLLAPFGPSYPPFVRTFLVMSCADPIH